VDETVIGGGVMDIKQFEKECFEIAFGDGAFENPLPYTREEVIERLQQFSNDALHWEYSELST
jgi:hypothetical protein